MSEKENTPVITVTPKREPDGQVADSSSASRAEPTVRLSDSEMGLLLPDAGHKGADGVHPDSVTSQYAIIEKIADGGMGVVFLARDRRLNRFVAIKRLNSTALSNPSLKERFFREAKAVAALNHIHIVHVYFFGEDAEGPYLIMEYVSGPAEASPNKVPHSPFTLGDRVHRNGPLPLNRALEFIIKMCRAIVYAHNSGVIHRDLKPSNVLLDESGEPKLVDFGLARIMGGADEDLTVPGEKMLSMGYGAPEQEQDATQADERSDVYGLAALLFFSLTGKNPRYFREADVPEALRMPMVKALETDKNKRWASARDFLDSLLLISAPSTVEMPNVKTTWRCKWCDTVNPLMISFCGNCGWDGSEKCAECGRETRAGIRFCGTCGADAREYETAHGILRKCQQRFREKAYPLVIHESSRIARFRPVGTNGRALVQQVEDLGRDAQKAIDRAAELKVQIPRETAAENYEFVQKHIEEYVALTDDRSFDDTHRKLPALLLARNLKRIRQAVKEREWAYALQACHAILANPACDHEEAARLLKNIRIRRGRAYAIRASAVVLIAFLVYLFSAAPLCRLLNKAPGAKFNAFYRLAAFVQRDTVFRGMMDTYASLWGIETLFKRPENGVAVSPVASGSMAALQAEHQAGLKDIEKNVSMNDAKRGHDYLGELQELQQRLQKAGDYEGWSAVSEELERYEKDPVIPVDAEEAVSGDLKGLLDKFRNSIRNASIERNRKIMALNNNTIHKLTELQVKMTKAGKMTDAAAVNAEIKKVKTDNELKTSEIDALQREAAGSPRPPREKKPKK